MTIILGVICNIISCDKIYYNLLFFQLSGSSHSLPQQCSPKEPQTSVTPTTRATPPKPPLPAPPPASLPAPLPAPLPTSLPTPLPTALPTPSPDPPPAQDKPVRQLTVSSGKNVLGTLPHHHLSVDELRLLQVSILSSCMNGRE